MGGVYVEKLQDSVTHLITDSVISIEYEVIIKEIYSILLLMFIIKKSFLCAESK